MAVAKNAVRTVGRCTGFKRAGRYLTVSLVHQYLYRDPAYFHYPNDPHGAYYEDDGFTA